MSQGIDLDQPIEPGLDQEFTIALQDLILNQTNLNLVTSNGDLVYEGEIVQYSITPTTSTANNTAAQNRLTMRVNVRYTNKLKEEDSFEQGFSFFMILTLINNFMILKQLQTKIYLKE